MAKRKRVPVISAASLNKAEADSQDFPQEENESTSCPEMEDQDSQNEEHNSPSESAEGLEIKEALPHDSEVIPGEENVADTPEDTRYRIDELVRVLSNFKEEREEGHSRKEYVELLAADLQNMYSYNEFLIMKLLDLLPTSEVVELLEANESARPMTIRVNTLKVKRRDLMNMLVARGVHLQAMEKWNNVGLQVFDSKVTVGATLEYLAGYYMIQSAVSFLPVLALDVQKEEKILDMAAAPGGKTSHICQLLDNTGLVFANDFSSERCKALYGNLQRLGCFRAIVTSLDGCKYGKMYPAYFDKILLDAPCSGSGIVSRDKTIKVSKNQDDVDICVIVQKKLLLSAIDSCKIGGYIVYSTCSLLVDENERVVDYALRKRGIQVVETGLPFGRPGFHRFRQYRMHTDLAKCKRFYPHLHNLDGFFVCKLKKVSDFVYTKRTSDEGLTLKLESKSKKRHITSTKKTPLKSTKAA
ncbi:nucleolar protein [Perkinsela sp. CCAP 1560/4]|nr:nucleolar protein [Perkinsela sp. CCAP 1560/4]|eukprot:KNH05664.1 nucleolar protein [Perkinsela sp. CCAP 1560/4]